MSKPRTRQEIIDEIAELQALLARYDAVPEDNFNFGTIIRIAANQNLTKWHLLKVAEDTWKYLGGQAEKSLQEWILQAIDQNLGYFEVYVLEAQENPIFVNEP